MSNIRKTEITSNLRWYEHGPTDQDVMFTYRHRRSHVIITIHKSHFPSVSVKRYVLAGSPRFFLRCDKNFFSIRNNWRNRSDKQRKSIRMTKFRMHTRPVQGMKNVTIQLQINKVAKDG